MRLYKSATGKADGTPSPHLQAADSHDALQKLRANGVVMVLANLQIQHGSNNWRFAEDTWTHLGGYKRYPDD